jgi:predicted RNA binding protein YcfA (HicA-like mRNA interferase family)
VRKLPSVSSSKVIKALERAGFVYAPKRGKGSHQAFYKIDEGGHKLLVIVPKRRELPKGTLLSILQQANLSREDFIKLLEAES